MCIAKQVDRLISDMDILGNDLINTDIDVIDKNQLEKLNQKCSAFMNVLSTQIAKIEKLSISNWEKLKTELEFVNSFGINAMDFRNRLSNAIINKCNNRNMTFKELESLSGVSHIIISRIVKRHITPELDTIYKIIEPLDIKIESLLEDAKDINSNNG